MSSGKPCKPMQSFVCPAFVSSSKFHNSSMLTYADARVKQMMILTTINTNVIGVSLHLKYVKVVLLKIAVYQKNTY